MEDKEVGKLWMVNKIPISEADELHNLQQDAICNLIRKLVEERAQRHYSHGVAWRDMQEFALRDFGIDPKDFA